MPTIIALDVSLSMRRLVVGTVGADGSQPEQLTRHNLAVQGINALIDYLQGNSKLEFVALVKKRIHYQFFVFVIISFQLYRNSFFFLNRSYSPLSTK